MAWAPDYTTLAELKSYLRITDTADDAELGFAITAASRAIDVAAGRQFGQTSPAAARYYSYGGAHDGNRQMLEIDDLMSKTGLVVKFDSNNDGVFETTLVEGTDFQLWPYNAAANGLPWTHIILAYGSIFPVLTREIEITALWGWSSVPVVIKQAALVQAARFFARRNSAYGIAGSPELGNEMRLLARLDPDVAVLVTSVKRLWTVR